jgi:hypothetical protein
MELEGNHLYNKPGICHLDSFYPFPKVRDCHSSLKVLLHGSIFKGTARTTAAGFSWDM